MKTTESEFLRVSKFQNRVNDKVSKCLICARACLISEGQRGRCLTKVRINGEIHTNVYGKLSYVLFDQTDKKPLFHFFPEEKLVTVGSYGCNFDCVWCQNYKISKRDPYSVGLDVKYVPPKELIFLAKVNECKGVALSLNEPTLFLDYGLDVFALAKKKGLHCIFVTNGYMTEDALNELIKRGLDAMVVNVKGTKEFLKKHCNADVEVVWRNAKIAKNRGVHIEFKTLVIPNYNFNENFLKETAKRICEEFGNSCPWHLEAFWPIHKKFALKTRRRTPIRIMNKSYEIGRSAGLKYVYVGNLFDHKYASTYCPSCNEMVIKRINSLVVSNSVTKDGKCPKCDYDLNIKS